MLIGTKLYFQMNHASSFGTMMAAFVLDTMPVKAAFQQCVHSDISSDIVESGFTVWSAISYHG